jgi:hypothetical protein
MAPPRELLAWHAAQYPVEIRLYGGAASSASRLYVVAYLDDGPAKTFNAFPAKLKLSDLGPVGPGEHLLVAYLTDFRGRLVKSSDGQAQGAVVKFRVNKMPEEGP